MLNQLWNDEAGFIVSAELILVATMLVIGLIVGMSEVQHAVVSELGDVGEAIGSLNQSYLFTGFRARKTDGDDAGSFKAITVGSSFRDSRDECDGNECDLDCTPAKPEGNK